MRKQSLALVLRNSRHDSCTASNDPFAFLSTRPAQTPTGSSLIRQIFPPSCFHQTDTFLSGTQVRVRGEGQIQQVCSENCGQYARGNSQTPIPTRQLSLHACTLKTSRQQELRDMGLASDLFGTDAHVNKLLRRLRTLQAGLQVNHSRKSPNSRFCSKSRFPVASAQHAEQSLKLNVEP